LHAYRFDLIYVYKIIFGMVEIDASTFFSVRNARERSMKI